VPILTTGAYLPCATTSLHPSTHPYTTNAHQTQQEAHHSPISEQAVPTYHFPSPRAHPHPMTLPCTRTHEKETAFESDGTRLGMTKPRTRPPIPTRGGIPPQYTDLWFFLFCLEILAGSVTFDRFSHWFDFD
jgi:hypothetical protein